MESIVRLVTPVASYTLRGRSQFAVIKACVLFTGGRSVCCMREQLGKRDKQESVHGIKWVFDSFVIRTHHFRPIP